MRSIRTIEIADAIQRDVEVKAHALIQEKASRANQLLH